MKKRLISIILALVLFIIPIQVYADDENIIEGEFTYLPAYAEPTTEKFYYSDDYFLQSGKKDNAHLTTMSLNLAISTFEVGSCEYTTDLFEKIGFSNIRDEDITNKPDRNTIGTVIASKKVGDYNLIAVAVRGKYAGEWASNFIVGTEGNIKGFNDASLKVIERIKTYIADYGLTNNKIWMAGYSRAGAVSNLCGVYINQNLSEFGTTADDLYIYTFEPPAACMDSTVYDNIYTVVNECDVVPYLCPQAWNAHTNGKRIVINESQTIMTYTGLIDAEECGEIELREFLTENFNWLGTNLTREAYSNNLEAALADLFEILPSRSDDEIMAFASHLKGDLTAKLLFKSELRKRVLSLARLALSDDSEAVYEELGAAICEVLDIVRTSKNFISVTDEEYEKIKGSILPIIKTIGPLLLVDYYENDQYPNYHFSTFFRNAANFTVNHAHQVNLLYVQALDDYYPDVTPENVQEKIAQVPLGSLVADDEDESSVSETDDSESTVSETEDSTAESTVESTESDGESGDKNAESEDESENSGKSNIPGILIPIILVSAAVLVGASFVILSLNKSKKDFGESKEK